MATRVTRAQRGRRRGERLARQLVGELAGARLVAGVSQNALALQLGRSQAQLSRFEALKRIDDASLVRIAEVASLLGLELSASLHPSGDAIRDKGHQALISRLRAELSLSLSTVVRAEVPFPAPGDPRAWDLVLRAEGQLVGVEAETRIRDVQALVRRIRQRERDGGVDEVLLVLSASRVNARLVHELRTALGDGYAASPRSLLNALRAGRRLPGSGVVML